MSNGNASELSDIQEACRSLGDTTSPESDPRGKETFTRIGRIEDLGAVEDELKLLPDSMRDQIGVALLDQGVTHERLRRVRSYLDSL
jgi:hypothetical protein